METGKAEAPPKAQVLLVSRFPAGALVRGGVQMCIVFPWKAAPEYFFCWELLILPVPNNVCNKSWLQGKPGEGGN